MKKIFSIVSIVVYTLEEEPEKETEEEHSGRRRKTWRKPRKGECIKEFGGNSASACNRNIQHSESSLFAHIGGSTASNMAKENTLNYIIFSS